MLLLLAGCGGKGKVSGGAGEEIEVLCAASLRVPVEEAARAFAAEGLGRVRMQFGGSQAMLSALEISGKGDVFLPADVSYIESARAKNLVREPVALAEMQAVIAVAQGNPRGVRGVADLAREDVRVVLANPELAAISQMTAKAWPAQTWRALAARAVAMKPTVNDVANDLALGAADAGIVWEVTVRQTRGIEAVVVPELSGVKGRAAGAVVSASPQAEAARRFLRWLAAPEKGGVIFSRHGYAPVSGEGTR